MKVTGLLENEEGCDEGTSELSKFSENDEGNEDDEEEEEEDGNGLVNVVGG